MELRDEVVARLKGAQPNAARATPPVATPQPNPPTGVRTPPTANTQSTPIRVVLGGNASAGQANQTNESSEGSESRVRMFQVERSDMSKSDEAKTSVSADEIKGSE